MRARRFLLLPLMVTASVLLVPPAAAERSDAGSSHISVLNFNRWGDLANREDLELAKIRLAEFQPDRVIIGSRSEKAVALMEQQDWDQALLEELSKVMMEASICGLGQAAPNPLLCAIKYFPEDL